MNKWQIYVYFKTDHTEILSLNFFFMEGTYAFWTKLILANLEYTRSFKKQFWNHIPSTFIIKIFRNNLFEGVYKRASSNKISCSLVICYGYCKDFDMCPSSLSLYEGSWGTVKGIRYSLKMGSSLSLSSSSVLITTGTLLSITTSIMFNKHAQMCDADDLF